MPHTKTVREIQRQNGSSLNYFFNTPHVCFLEFVFDLFMFGGANVG